MSENDNPIENNVDCNKDESAIQRTEEAGIFNVLIPKVEPHSSGTSDTDEDRFNDVSII